MKLLYIICEISPHKTISVAKQIVNIVRRMKESAIISLPSDPGKNKFNFDYFCDHDNEDNHIREFIILIFLF